MTNAQCGTTSPPRDLQTSAPFAAKGKGLSRAQHIMMFGIEADYLLCSWHFSTCVGKFDAMKNYERLFNRLLQNILTGYLQKVQCVACIALPSVGRSYLLLQLCCQRRRNHEQSAFLHITRAGERRDISFDLTKACLGQRHHAGFHLFTHCSSAQPDGQTMARVASVS